MNVGTVVHEMLHAAGFWHEQSRPDRDDHVRIQWANIKAGKEDNFARYDRGEVSTLELAYDVGSVMHYGARAFSRNGLDTIVSVAGTKKLGQRRGFTDLDAAKLNTLYACEESKGEVRPDSKLCRDVYTKGLCQSWGHEGGCVEYRDFMRDKCPKTCGYCEVECFDRDPECESLTLFKGQCEIREEFMRQNCPKSCGFCTQFNGFFGKKELGYKGSGSAAYSATNSVDISTKASMLVFAIVLHLHSLVFSQ